MKHIVANDRGWELVRSIRRRMEDEQYDSSLLDSIQGSPSQRPAIGQAVVPLPPVPEGRRL